MRHLSDTRTTTPSESLASRLTRRDISRRRLLAIVGTGLSVSWGTSWLGSVPRAAAQPPATEPITLTAGKLTARIRDNSRSPEILSGFDSLFHLDEPDFDAFDPETAGASAGLNFEHIIGGHRSQHNSFTPRQGPFSLQRFPTSQSVQLTRKREDDPWSVSSELRYELVEPHYIDVDFRCRIHDRALFGQRGSAIFFFANYMNDVAQVPLNFLGIRAEGASETWIAADAPPGHSDWNQGGTYRSHLASDLEYDTDHNFKLNSWSYDYPRFTKPFYYGRAGRNMSLTLMFDKSHTPSEEIRFSLFKFKLPRFPRPAWDFQYVIRQIEEQREYGFRARVVWKKFVSPEDCLAEYDTWSTRRD